MKFSSSAAVPAALVILCAVTPALAHGTRAAPTVATQSTGAYGILDALAAAAAPKPGDLDGPAAVPHPSSAAAPAEAVRHVRTARRGRHHDRRSARRRGAQPAMPIAEAAAPAPAPIAEGGNRNLPALVAAYARKEGIPPALAHSVVMVESRYRPHATGRGGYVGLMQLSYRTARSMGFRGSRAGLYDPETNIRLGVHYLAVAYRQSGGKLCATVSKYQGGIGVHGVTRAGAAYCGRVRRYMADAAPTRRAEIADNGQRS